MSFRLYEMAHSVLSSRVPNKFCDEFWNDGQFRATPSEWLLNGENLDKMKMCDAARMILTNYENAEIVGCRLNGKIDELIIRFVDYDDASHQNRVRDGMKFLHRSKENLKEITKLPEKCEIMTNFQMNEFCHSIKMIDGSFVPIRTLWMECCSRNSCCEWQMRALKDLDMIRLYPTNENGTKITIMNLANQLPMKLLSTVFEFVNLEYRKLSEIVMFGVSVAEFNEMVASHCSFSAAGKMMKDGHMKLNDLKDINLNKIDMSCFNYLESKMEQSFYVSEVGTHLPGVNEGGVFKRIIYGDISELVKTKWFDRRV